ncbi:Release factor glutamine methyltransferase [Candidatus Desulfarcum epimagneticum]|uniref:Release factor glutamine methyltransferase n=1 Tax=uncultured Desulfobacteraceae bacterium TaxID=218296 RepID=A0A484HLG8_9BACT|nr:Release factor glutamine methyltransferase [uncultured Desulfobacteraceae bacterium]
MTKNPRAADAGAETRWTILKILSWTASYFKSRNVEAPRPSAEILLAHALGIERIQLYVQYDRPLNKDELAAFRNLVKRRARFEPAAYITGEKEFWSLPFAVTCDVLIPRPETECLVEAALAFLKQDSPEGRPKRVLELGAGSGAVICALASEAGEHLYFASDISPGALQIASANAKKNGLEHAIRFFASNWLGAVKKNAPPFDLIVSNPPYIRAGEIAGLASEIRLHEPRLSLDGSADGLLCLRAIVETAAEFLKPGGMLALETGFDQKNDVLDLARSCGAYENMVCSNDYSGLHRVACMARK